MVENCPALKRRLSKYADIRHHLADTAGGMDEMEVERKKEEAEEDFDDEEEFEAADLLGIEHHGEAGADGAKMMHMMHEMLHGLKRLDARMEKLEAASGGGDNA